MKSKTQIQGIKLKRMVKRDSCFKFEAKQSP
jgi:hypothetical protein